MNIMERFHLPSLLSTRQGVLVSMAQVAHEHSERSFNLLQESALLVSEKLQLQLELTEAEICFIKTLFMNPWWGGERFGAMESLYLAEQMPARKNTAAEPLSRNIIDANQMEILRYLRHFCEGKGKLLAAGLPVYKNSVIVNDTLKALKNFMRQKLASNFPITMLDTKQKEFIDCHYAGEIERSRKQAHDQGYIFNDGTLMLEQKEKGLRIFSNRFYISSMTSRIGNKFHSRWRVNGYFNFHNEDESNQEFELPLTRYLNLKVPANLSRVLTIHSDANPFAYFVDWAETHTL